MPEFVVPAESRSETGKNVNRRLRRRKVPKGQVPINRSHLANRVLDKIFIP